MRLEDIKSAVESGQYVYWKNEGYQVIKDSIGQWLILCHFNGSCIGLTWQDGVTMNGDEWDFHIRPEPIEDDIDDILDQACHTINALWTSRGGETLDSDELSDLNDLLEEYLYSKRKRV